MVGRHSSDQEETEVEARSGASHDLLEVVDLGSLAIESGRVESHALTIVGLESSPDGHLGVGWVGQNDSRVGDKRYPLGRDLSMNIEPRGDGLVGKVVHVIVVHVNVVSELVGLVMDIEVNAVNLVGVGNSLEIHEVAWNGSQLSSRLAHAGISKFTSSVEILEQVSTLWSTG